MNRLLRVLLADVPPPLVDDRQPNRIRILRKLLADTDTLQAMNLLLHPVRGTLTYDESFVTINP